jgi:hypothetical protein
VNLVMVSRSTTTAAVKTSNRAENITTATVLRLVTLLLRLGGRRMAEGPMMATVEAAGRAKKGPRSTTLQAARPKR